MHRELWYPDLHPPTRQFRLSVLYGDGFASVLPSWSLREGHRAWRDLELLRSRGLYEPLRLRDLLEDPAVRRALPVQLTAFAHEVAMSPDVSPALRTWGAAVLAGESPDYGDGLAGEAMTVARRGMGTNSFSTHSPDGAPFELMELLVDQFGFAQATPSSPVIRAPREVVDRIVRVAVGNVASTRSDLVPTTEVADLALLSAGERHPRGTLAWVFSLPAPPDNWTLADVLRVRDEHAEALERLRQHLANVPPPGSESDVIELRRHLDGQLRKDLSRLGRALGDDPRRRYLKAVVLVGANIALGEVLGGAVSEWGVAASVGLAVVTDLVVPALRGDLTPSNGLLPPGAFAYSRPRQVRGQRVGWAAPGPIGS